MVGWLRTLLSGLLDLVYPPQCLVCGNALAAEEHMVCRPCHQEMPRLPAQVCGSCGAPVDMDSLRMCPQCPEVQEFNHARSGFDYHHEPMRGLLHAFKFDGITELSVPLGEWLVETIWRFYPDAVYDGVVSVPLHSERLKHREFNQSELLAQVVREETGWPVLTHAVQRIRNTRPQSRLNPSEREANMINAFAVVQPGVVTGKTLLLVDDIFTTGSTVNELARVLREAGARRVDVVTLTRAFETGDSPA